MTPADQARIDFVLQLRRRWAEQLYPALRDQYEKSDTGPADVEAAVHALPAYRWFAFLERNAQKALWRAVDEAVGDEAGAPAGHKRTARVQLDPNLKLPTWYTGVDIHIQPGGVWSSKHAARVYELGAKLVMLAKTTTTRSTACSPRPPCRRAATSASSTWAAASASRPGRSSRRTRMPR